MIEKRKIRMSNDNGTMCNELPHSGKWVGIAVVGWYSAMVCGDCVDVLVYDQCGRVGETKERWRHFMPFVSAESSWSCV